MSSFGESLEQFSALDEVVVPDLWQQEAVSALRAGQDVVVHAPTGAGKTLIFELWANMGKPKGKAVYTVPTRALANDKLAEWRAREWPVGIATGDLAENLNIKKVTHKNQNLSFSREFDAVLINFKSIVIDEISNFSTHKIVNETVDRISETYKGKFKPQVNPRILNIRIENKNFSGHSLRSGFATVAAESGADERSIMAMTGHKTTQMVRRYIKEANLFKNNALNKVKL